ncbi:MAG: heme o synthase [Tepidisphaerales bacterium]
MRVTTATATAATGFRLGDRLADYRELAKPRLNFLVLVTTGVGYYMGVRYSMDWGRLLHTLIGTALTAAAASALNQFAERREDALMKRTANRPLPQERLSPAEALVFGLVLAAAGLLWLLLAVNALTAGLGLFTLLSYVLIYTPMKRTTTLNTIVGAVPGAIPPVMGFTAVRNELSPEALGLFAILFLWQMPHFLAIAILYRDDYRRAGFKMLPVVDEDLSLSSRQIVVYCLALIPATLLVIPLRMAGGMYFAAAVTLGTAFLCFGARAAATRSRLDCRRLFLASVLYLPLLLAFLMIDKR